MSDFSVGADSGAAEEGITIAMIEDKDKLDVGAGGDMMHSLNASDAGRIEINLLKTSPTNAYLNAMYNFQKNNPGSWGQIVFRGADTYRGDVIDGSELAIVKQSDLGFAKNGNMNKWVFHGRVEQLLGTGVAALT